MALAIIAIGSNLGDRLAHLREASRAISLLLTNIRVSHIYESPALTCDGSVKPPYYNAIIIGNTKQSPDDILTALMAIEQSMGRERRTKWESRTIDLDVIAVDDTCIHSPTLTLPHPHLSSRAFVLKPLVELLPTWRHPILNKTASELLEKLNTDNSDQTAHCVPVQTL